jgi:hypothetical protein
LLALPLLPWLALVLTGGGIHSHHPSPADAASHNAASNERDTREAYAGWQLRVDASQTPGDPDSGTCIACLWQRTAEGSTPVSPACPDPTALTSLSAMPSVGVFLSITTTSRPRAPPGV